MRGYCSSTRNLVNQLPLVLISRYFLALIKAFEPMIIETSSIENGTIKVVGISILSCAIIDSFVQVRIIGNDIGKLRIKEQADIADYCQRDVYRSK